MKTSHRFALVVSLVLSLDDVRKTVRATQTQYSQYNCSGVNLNDDPDGACGANREGLTDTNPHGPFCCQDPSQTCCTYSYVGDNAVCTDVSIASVENSGSYCHGFCTFDPFQGLEMMDQMEEAQREALMNSLIHNCSTSEIRRTGVTSFVLSSHEFTDATRGWVGVNKSASPSTTCRIECDGQELSCDPVDLGCRTDPTNGHELINLTNNAVITSNDAILVVTNNVAVLPNDATCPPLELPLGAVPFFPDEILTDIGCIQGGASYKPAMETDANGQNSYCMAKCDSDQGYDFSVIYVACRYDEATNETYFTFNRDRNFTCACEVGQFVSPEDGSCVECPSGRYSMFPSSGTECTACPSGRSTKNEEGQYECMVCDFLFIGSDDCSFPVLGLIFAVAAFAMLLAVSAVIIQRCQLQKARERSLHQDIEEKSKLIAANAHDLTLLSSGWILDASEVKFVKRLAAGAEGEVWKGRLRGRYDVAVKKVFDTEGMCLEDNDEVRFLQRARHPRLVMFMGAGYLPSKAGVFVVLEFCECGSMSSYLMGDRDGSARDEQGVDTRRQVPWTRRLALLCDVADGMAYLHLVHKSVHRDLKLDNVLLSMEDGTLRAKVADFGLSRLIDGGRTQKALRNEEEQRKYDSSFEDDGDGDDQVESKDDSISSVKSTTAFLSQRPSIPSSTSTTSMTSSLMSVSKTMTAGCGTPAYMAPEIIANLRKNKHRYGAPIDVYSFGIIMVEVATMVPAWMEKRYGHEIFQAVEEGHRPIFGKEAVASCGETYITLMKACWDQDPEARPAFDVVLNTLRDVSFLKKNTSGQSTRNEAASSEQTKAGVVEIELA